MLSSEVGGGNKVFYLNVYHILRGNGKLKVHSISTNVTIIGKLVGHQIALLGNSRVIGGQDQVSIKG